MATEKDSYRWLDIKGVPQVNSITGGLMRMRTQPIHSRKDDGEAFAEFEEKLEKRRQ
jgi:hypothetical protein